MGLRCYHEMKQKLHPNLKLSLVDIDAFWIIENQINANNNLLN
jgi:hypothetical protein